MSTIAAGVFKRLIFAKQGSQGTQAAAGGTSKALRRVTSSLDLKKAQYKSNEIRPSMMRADNRHGVRSVSGSINGELSAGTYQSFFESLLRQAAQAVKTTGAQTTFASAQTTGAAGTITRSAGSFLTDGFDVGDVVRQTGWTTGGVNLNSRNQMITALTATVMTLVNLDGTAFVTKVAGDSVTIVQAGKKTYVPQSGHTRDYYTIEHYFGDLALSEQFVDCVISKAQIKIPATGIATVQFDVMGLNLVTSSGAQYFSAAGAPSTTSLFAASTGVLVVNGTKVGIITGLDITIDGNYTVPGGVVGSNVDPDVFPGMIDVSGNVTILFDSATYRDLFINETVSTLAFALTVDTTAASDVFAVTLPDIKLGGADKNDGEVGLSLTMPFIATELTTGGAALGNLQTVISIMDSQFS